MGKYSLLLEDSNPYQERVKVMTPIINKWKRTGLLDELEHEYDVAHMAIMLENQAKQLVREASVTGTTANQEQWSGVALPLVRRVFGEIASKEFLSVQPMNLPSGLVFYLDFKYGTDRSYRFGFAPTSASQQGTLHGITNVVGNPSDGLYGAGKWGYSINLVSASVTATTASVSYSDVNFDADFSASVAQGQQLRQLIVATSSLSSMDANGIRSFGAVSGSGTQYTVFPQFTRISGGNLIMIVSSSGLNANGAAAAQPSIVYYHIAPATDYARNDFETTRSEASLAIPELELDLRQEPIIAKTRKLKAIWTPEFAQDINAYHSIDAEAELTSMLSEYVSMEVDLELLDMLIQNAQTTDYWSANINTVINATQTGWQTQASSYYPTQNAWFMTFGTKVQKVSNKIHQKTMRGGANFLVCSPDVATILESIPGYAADTNGDKMKFAMGVQKIGQLNSRFQVYKNPYMQENTVLMGFRGSQFLETGAVYAPYVPLIMTPLIYDPTNMTPRRAVMTRYAKKITRPEFYGKLYVADLNMV